MVKSCLFPKQPQAKMPHNTSKETNNLMCTLRYEFTCNICTLRYEHTCNVSAKFTFFLGFNNVRTTQSKFLQKKTVFSACSFRAACQIWTYLCDLSCQIKCPYISGTTFTNRDCHKIILLLVPNTDLEVKSCFTEQIDFTWKTTSTLNTN